MTAKANDDTFSEVSAYGSRLWCAARLGKSIDWFYRNFSDLLQQGFPQPDPILGRFHKGDVNNWIENRAKSATVVISGRSESVINRENLHAL